MSDDNPAPGLFSSLGDRDFRLLMVGLTTSQIGTWAYTVALSVWVYDSTHSPGWVAAANVGRFVPALLFGAYAGVIAERFERTRLLAAVNLISVALMAAMSLELAIGHAVWLAVAIAGANSMAGSITEPAITAMTPQLVGEQHLGSANSLRNTIEDLAVFAGPAVGAVLLLLGPPWVIAGGNAATYAIAAVVFSRLRARSTPVDVTNGGEVRAFRQMLVGIGAIISSRSAAVLVGYSLIASFVYGIDGVQYVLVSQQVLGTGARGYGYLLAGLGIGGVLAAGLVVRLERLPKLSAVITIGLAVYCLPTLLFLVVHAPLAGFAIQVVRGVGTVIVDVLAITALQRSVASTVLARVFGVFNALVLLAIVLGGAIAPPMVRVIGLSGSLWVAGLGVPVLGLAGWPALRRMDAAAAARRASLAPARLLTESCHLFDLVSAGGIDQLAGSATWRDVAASDLVVAEGDPADFFYVIASGRFTVSTEVPAARDVPVLAAGEYFGEIGLIERIPRTASVMSMGVGRLLCIPGSAFIDALTEAIPSTALLNGAAARLGRTHPGRSLSTIGLIADRG